MKKLRAISSVWPACHSEIILGMSCSLAWVPLWLCKRRFRSLLVFHLFVSNGINSRSWHLKVVVESVRLGGIINGFDTLVEKLDCVFTLINRGCHVPKLPASLGRWGTCSTVRATSSVERLSSTFFMFLVSILPMTFLAIEFVAVLHDRTLWFEPVDFDKDFFWVATRTHVGVCALCFFHRLFSFLLWVKTEGVLVTVHRADADGTWRSLLDLPWHV